MINIVEKIGRSLFAQYLVDFGFNNKTNLTIEGEVYAQIPPYEKWPRAQFFNMSFGQGISVTMLQMASAYSVLANGGIYMQPYIIESMLYPDGKKIETVPTPLRRVIKESTSKQVTAMLVDGVRN
jgi:cell division protein FtsI/penicillin-binding protein 2